ncbi:MAG: hypothetical protein JWO67_174 [Streptosporangiaceae bacterium]|nr:hypothetical protein [Streptosporangiaceae bacterium]
MRRWDRPDASMSLLADLLAGTGLEPGYEAAAVRRAASGDRRSRYGAGARLFAATLVLGLLGAVAVAQVRRGEPVAERQRRALIAQIRPLSPPYAVTAAGDPGTIENAFADSPAGRAFRTLKTTFGIRYDIRKEDSVRLPAAPAPRLRYARQETSG